MGGEGEEEITFVNIYVWFPARPQGLSALWLVSEGMALVPERVCSKAGGPWIVAFSRTAVFTLQTKGDVGSPARPSTNPRQLVSNDSQSISRLNWLNNARRDTGENGRRLSRRLVFWFHEVPFGALI